MPIDYDTFQTEIRGAFRAASTPDELEALRVRYLGKKGSVTLLLSQIKDIPDVERPLFGQKIN